VIDVLRRQAMQNHMGISLIGGFGGLRGIKNRLRRQKA
jgi:hypothetical protein